MDHNWNQEKTHGVDEFRCRSFQKYKIYVGYSSFEGRKNVISGMSISVGYFKILN